MTSRNEYARGYERISLLLLQAGMHGVCYRNACYRVQLSGAIFTHGVMPGYEVGRVLKIAIIRRSDTVMGFGILPHRWAINEHS